MTYTLANGSDTSRDLSEKALRRLLIEQGLVGPITNEMPITDVIGWVNKIGAGAVTITQDGGS